MERMFLAVANSSQCVQVLSLMACGRRCVPDLQCCFLQSGRATGFQVQEESRAACVGHRWEPACANMTLDRWQADSGCRLFSRRIVRVTAWWPVSFHASPLVVTEGRSAFATLELSSPFFSLGFSTSSLFLFRSPLRQLTKQDSYWMHSAQVCRRVCCTRGGDLPAATAHLLPLLVSQFLLIYFSENVSWLW